MLTLRERFMVKTAAKRDWRGEKIERVKEEREPERGMKILEASVV